MRECRSEEHGKLLQDSRGLLAVVPSVYIVGIHCVIRLIEFINLRHRRLSFLCWLFNAGSNAANSTIENCTTDEISPIIQTPGYVHAHLHATWPLSYFHARCPA